MKGMIWGSKQIYYLLLDKGWLFFKISISSANRKEMFHVTNCVLNLGDGNWYRALVKEILPNGNVKVHFVDYGNIEEVTADELRMISSTFLNLPFQGIRCRLAGMVYHKKLSQLLSNTCGI